MLQTFNSLFKIPDLRRRIWFVLAMCVVYRIGGMVPIPGIDATGLLNYMQQMNNTLFGMYDMFVGGSFKKMSIFALGIMPYISASIIIQLLESVVPFFQRLRKEGEEGRKKLTQYTRYGTVLLAAAQAFGIAKWLENQNEFGVVSNPGVGFISLVMITIIAGTIFIMWLGEQMTENGIGNGISLLIFIGIVARFPYAIRSQFLELKAGRMSLFTAIFLLAFMFVVVAAVVMLTQGQRRIKVQYPKKVVGRKVYSGQSTYIPLRVNTAGVIPIIFAQAIMFVPTTLATLLPWEFLRLFSQRYFSMSHPVYWFFYGLLIIFFTYFYTAIVFNPVDLADNLKKYGAVVPQKPPGKKTAEFIDKILTRITLPGSVFLALIAIMPYFIGTFMKVNYEFASFFGGTGLLIVVGVALDTLQQIEAKLVERHYEGLLKGGRIKGRR
jgi:preprotein translocase subunit SecY